MWEQIKDKRLKGLSFHRQKVIGRYIADFYCAGNKTVIEIDGESHDDYKAAYDREREIFLKNLGLRVIHISDNDVKKNLQGVLEYLNEVL